MQCMPILGLMPTSKSQASSSVVRLSRTPTSAAGKPVHPPMPGSASFGSGQAKSVDPSPALLPSARFRAPCSAPLSKKLRLKQYKQCRRPSWPGISIFLWLPSFPPTLSLRCGPNMSGTDDPTNTPPVGEKGAAPSIDSNDDAAVLGTFSQWLRSTAELCAPIEAKSLVLQPSWDTSRSCAAISP